jgi:hypothetical protein
MILAHVYCMNFVYDRITYEVYIYARDFGGVTQFVGIVADQA